MAPLKFIKGKNALMSVLFEANWTIRIYYKVFRSQQPFDIPSVAIFNSTVSSLYKNSQKNLGILSVVGPAAKLPKETFFSNYNTPHSNSSQFLHDSYHLLPFLNHFFEVPRDSFLNVLGLYGFCNSLCLDFCPQVTQDLNHIFYKETPKKYTNTHFGDRAENTIRVHWHEVWWWSNSCGHWLSKLKKMWMDGVFFPIHII